MSNKGKKILSMADHLFKKGKWKRVDPYTTKAYRVPKELKKNLGVKTDILPLGGGGNFTLQGKDFYISYSPLVDETALVRDGKYFILNGDFREEYEKLLPYGFTMVKRSVYDKHKDQHGSFWSMFDDGDDE